MDMWKIKDPPICNLKSEIMTGGLIMNYRKIL
jgi:hypothetical protein